MSYAADREIHDLNMTLSEDGEWIEIRRLYGTQLIPVSVTCRAFVRAINAEELAAGISQDNSNVVISPSEIIAAGWPGPWTPTLPAEPVNPGTDRRVPKKGDKAVIKNRVRNIEFARPVYVDDELVRINLRVLG
jgi:hypothetical protein